MPGDGTTGAPSGREQFRLLNAVSIVVTFLIGVALAVYGQLVPEAPALHHLTRRAMMYLGLIHFAVGYHFFFTSPRTHQRWATERPQVVLSLVGCLALSVAAFRTYPFTELLVYTLFYLHAAENGIYHLFRMTERDPEAHQRVGLGALFPLFLLLLAFRVISPTYLGRADQTLVRAQLALVAACAVFVRLLLPRTAWRAGWRVIQDHYLLLAMFLIIALLYPERSYGYDLFIIWHYVMWFGYTWLQQPQVRGKLVWSHALFALIYGATFTLTAGGVPWTAVLGSFSAVGYASFSAQTTCHILLSFAFRRYPLAARQPAVTPAVAG